MPLIANHISAAYKHKRVLFPSVEQMSVPTQKTAIGTSRGIYSCHFTAACFGQKRIFSRWWGRLDSGWVGCHLHRCTWTGRLRKSACELAIFGYLFLGCVQGFFPKKCRPVTICHYCETVVSIYVQRLATNLQWLRSHGKQGACKYLEQVSGDYYDPLLGCDHKTLWSLKRVK